MCQEMVLISTRNAETALHRETCRISLLHRIWQWGKESISLHQLPAEVFARCQWQRGQSPSLAYLLYRWVIFLGVTSIAIASFACQKISDRHQGAPVKLNYFKWFIYFTNWGYMLIVLQAGLALAVVHRYRHQSTRNIRNELMAHLVLGILRRPWTPDTLKDYISVPYTFCIIRLICTVLSRTNLPFKPSIVVTSEEEAIANEAVAVRTPLLCRLYWLTFTIATDLAFVITIIYWALVYDPNIHDLDTLNVLVHGCNSAIMLFELSVTAHPMRAAHGLYGVATGLLYGAFSAFYWAIGGTDRHGTPAIYPSLDWNKPGKAVGFVVICAVVLIMSHGFATCVATVRLRLATRYNISSRQSRQIKQRRSIPDL